MSYLQFREVPQSLDARIEFARKNKELEPDCYGTAFFLLGVLPYDMVIFTSGDFVPEALKRMQLEKAPRDNSIIISSVNGVIEHASFIRTANPLFGYQREGAEGKLTQVNSLGDIERYVRSTHLILPGLLKFELVNKTYSLKKEDHLDDWAKRIVENYHPGWWG